MKSHWTHLLTQAIESKPDKIPKGFQTVAQIAEETGQGESTIRRKIKKLLAAGKVEMQTFKASDVNGRLLPATFYRQK